jgi:hypothetical protein
MMRTPMVDRFRLPAQLVVVALALALPSVAQAALKASTSIQSSGGVTRIVVKLSSTTRLTGKRAPRTVSLRVHGKTYRLSRARAARAAAVSLGTWRSAGLTGAAGTGLLSLRGARATVSVRSVGGTTSTISSTVSRASGGSTPSTPAPPAPTPGPAPLFAAPGRLLIGNEAFNSISKYFLNSEFSDCAVGRWPYCAVENRYEHGPEGSWEYHRCTPTSGSDINAYRSDLKVVGVEQAADGSWKIEYTVNEGQGFYHWEISTTGAVNGYYSFNGGPQEQLPGLIWRQPAHLGDCYS